MDFLFCTFQLLRQGTLTCRAGVALKRLRTRLVLFRHALITIRLYFYLFLTMLSFETCYVFVRNEEDFDCLQ